MRRFIMVLSVIIVATLLLTQMLFAMSTGEVVVVSSKFSWLGWLFYGTPLLLSLINLFFLILLNRKFNKFLHKQ